MNEEFDTDIDIDLPPMVQGSDSLDERFSHVGHHNTLRSFTGKHEVRLRQLELRVAWLSLFLAATGFLSLAAFFIAVGR